MAEGGIRITAKRRVAQFLIWKPAAVQIDGASVGEARWRQPVFFPTAVGTHEVAVGFPYLGKKIVGIGSAQVDVAADQVVEITYRTPWIVTMKGSIRVR
jgi:hypothetical protein